MSSSVQQAVLNGFATEITTATALPVDSYKQLFEDNRHKIYSLAFWMTDNEMTAEDISSTVFTRTFSRAVSTPEAVVAAIDSNLVTALRELMPIGLLSLETSITNSKPIVGNTKRIHLERAVVQVPATERLAFLLHDVENYDHARIANMIGITEDESRAAVCNARILVRELVSQML
ncbi:MAG: sigma-24, subfamily [Acidobacteriales bacterium]|nr:sigma-24, subfamily [Terriglobales bacterium]